METTKTTVTRKLIRSDLEIVIDESGRIIALVPPTHSESDMTLFDLQDGTE